MTRSGPDKIKQLSYHFLELFLKKLDGFNVSFIDCCHTRFIGIRQPRISTTELMAFCTECNIYREIKDFIKGNS